MVYAYLFEAGFDADGPHVRYGSDVSACIGKSPETVEAIRLAAIKLGVEEPTDLVRTLKAMFLRAQITGGSLYLIKTEDPMTFEEIDKYLQALGRDGKLKAFLEKAKVA